MNLIGKKVKLFLINSLSVEGQVELWDSEKAVLHSNNKKLVINEPSKNIIMYYSFEEAPPEAPRPVEKPNKKHFWEIEEPELQDLSLKDQNLKLKKIAELKTMSAEAQREQIRKELTTFRPIDTSQIVGKYGTPSFISPQYSAPEKINVGDASDIGGLPQVPRKTSE